MSVKVMSMVYAAHFHDITFTRKAKKRQTGEVYEKTVRVLNSNLKTVCVALADHANDEGEGSYPSVETLESKTELSNVTVVACLKAMKQEGIISYAGRSKWNTGNYTVNKSKLEEMATWERQKRRDPKSEATSHPESEAASFSKVKPLHKESEAASHKPSIRPKPSLIITANPDLDMFAGYFNKFLSVKELERWQVLYEAVGQERADELLAWAFKKEIHLSNRGGLMDSLETAAKNWKDKPARNNGKNKPAPAPAVKHNEADLEALREQARRELLHANA